MYEYFIAGAAWLLLDRPEGNPILRQISAGDTQVWVVDTQNRLYRRKDIVSILPEGTSWEFVAENVLHVSVGMHDQVCTSFLIIYDASCI